MFQDISKRSDGAKIVLARYLSRLVHKNENISELFVLVSNISGIKPNISSFVSFLHLCKQVSPPSFLLETSSQINHGFPSKHPIDSTIFACFTAMFVTFGILLSKVIPSEHTVLDGLIALL